MKNKEIVIIANGGFLAATAHSLPVEHFYKFHKFRRAVEKAYRDIAAQQVDLMKECGLDPAALNAADQEARKRFDSVNNDMLAEGSPVTVKARIPFELYKGFYDENRQTINGRQIDIFANIEVENIILDNLFEAGEGDEE